MEIQNPEMGQDAPQDPNATAQQQDAQYSQLTNLAQLISGAPPENAGDAGAQQAAEPKIEPQEQGQYKKLLYLFHSRPHKKLIEINLVFFVCGGGFIFSSFIFLNSSRLTRYLLH
jgi:hypothetical protein